MNPEPRSMSDEDQRLIEEYLNNGGKITKKAYGERSEEIEFSSGFYQRRKKKTDISIDNDNS